MSEPAPELSISIVSHGQLALVQQLLQDLEKQCAGTSLEIILTLNIPEPLSIDPTASTLPLSVISNPQPKGFGQNHNAAFTQARGRFFCVLNPDVRLLSNPFPEILSALSNPIVGVAAPRIVDQNGKVEDSARHFPTLKELFGKLFGGRSAVFEGRATAENAPDWLAGMFLVFTHDVFEQLGGFDERYFLYYEDVDICMRLRLMGKQARLCSEVSAIHQARRSSHRNLRYLYWHISSVVRYFLSSPYRQMRQQRRG